MLQPGREADLALEPFDAQRGGQLGAKHLDRDVAIVTQVARAPDRGHPPAPELELEPVAIGEGATKAVVRVRRHLVFRRKVLQYRPAEGPARPGRDG